MRNDPDFSYFNDEGKKVSGAAAFNHHVYSEMGGIQNYNDSIGSAYIEEFVKEHSDIINAGIEVNAKRRRIRRVS